MSKTRTKAWALQKLQALGDDVTAEEKKAILCQLIGHSEIITTSFGYFYCARCGDQIGDALGRGDSASENVIVGHDCPACRKNWKGLDWRSKLLAPDPFAKPKEET